MTFGRDIASGFSQRLAIAAALIYLAGFLIGFVLGEFL